MVRTALITGTSFFLLGLVWLMDSGESAGGVAPRPAAPSVRRIAFPHGKHVPVEWLQGEVARDCRGCHDYASGRDPEATCSACHFDSASGAPTLQVSGRVASLRTPGSPFVHNDHVSLDCAGCHIDPNNTRRSVPDELYVPEGLGWCVKCHDPAAPSGRGVVKPSNPAKADLGLQTALNQCGALAPRGSNTFRHTDHIASGDLANASRAAGVCKDCHSTIDQTQMDLGDHTFAVADCAECHLEASGSGLPLKRETRNRVSGADGTFWHADHLTEAAKQKSSAIGRDSCLACHDWRSVAGQAVPTYGVRVGFEKFDACVKCHDDSRAKDLANWHIDRHGEVDNCAGCHVIGRVNDMKTERRMRDMPVARARPKAFRVLKHAHPHISSKDGPPAQSCAKCHVAEAPNFGSRIREKPFDHRSHLNLSGGELTAQACLECHVVDASGMIHAQEIDGAALNYKPDVCVSCHQVVETATAQPIAPTELLDYTGNVLFFSHADHAKWDGDGRSMSCNECHVLATAGAPAPAGDDFVYAAGAVSCSKCHDHEKNLARTGGAGAELDSVKKCLVCHKVGVPERDQDVFMTRTHLTALGGRQFHPLPNEKRCSACHTLTPAGFAASVPNVVTGDRVGYTSGSDFHNVTGSQPDYCLACHWNSLSASKYKPRKAVLDGALQDAGPLGLTNSRRIREALGAQTRNYPGLVR